MIAKFVRLHVLFHCSIAQLNCAMSSSLELCSDDFDEMSALQVPLREHVPVDKESEESSHRVVHAASDSSLLQVPSLSETSKAGTVGSITARVHSLLAARWQAIYLTCALCFVSVAWFGAALSYYVPKVESQSASTLGYLEPLPIAKAEQMAAKPCSEQVLPQSVDPKDLRAAVGWALAACLCLGLVHWTLGALPGLKVHEGGLLATHSRRRLLEVVGVGCGILASGASHMWLATESDQLPKNSLAEQLLRVLGFGGTDFRGRGARLALIAGALYFAALLVQGPMLGGDVHNGGQLLNISGFDAFIVTAAFAVLFNEACSCRALVGMTIIRSSSLAVAALMSHVSVSREEIGAGLVSCCFLVSATLCTRLSVRSGVSPLAVFILGAQAAALMSTVHCAIGVFDGGLHAEVGGWVVAEGLALSVCFSFGLFCVAKALSYPFAGLCTQIWGSNVVLVLAFEALRNPDFRNTSLAQTPHAMYPYHWPVIAGVVGVALGAAICASVGPSPEPDEKPVKDLSGFALSVFGIRLVGKD